MILPSIIGYKLLPDLVAQHRTADAYVLLVLKLLPAGMIGVVIAALLSATMATVSSDFSSIASVLSEDVYHRLFRPAATPVHLLRAARVITVVVGLSSLSCSLWIAFSGQQSLLELMVTVAGVFLAPSYLPLLAALALRQLTWKGALVGYCAGSACGLTMLFVRFSEAARHTDRWLRNFDGASILLNTAVTIVGLWAGSRFLRQGNEERERIEKFFRELKVPVHAPESSSRPQKEIALITIALGALLGVAGLCSVSTGARAADSIVALILVVIGLAMGRTVRSRRASLD